MNYKLKHSRKLNQFSTWTTSGSFSAVFRKVDKNIGKNWSRLSQSLTKKWILRSLWRGSDCRQRQFSHFWLESSNSSSIRWVKCWSESLLTSNSRVMMKSWVNGAMKTCYLQINLPEANRRSINDSLTCSLLKEHIKSKSISASKMTNLY